MEVPKRSGVAGLYVDSEHVYYSYTEVNKKEFSRKKYFINKYLHDGTIVKNFCCDSFVCGIGQSEGFTFYTQT